MQVVKLQSSHTQSLQVFCDRCNEAGYRNNGSLESMKWDSCYDLPQRPVFWALIKDQQIISVSGCHRWDNLDSNHDQLRCLFRSATLPEFQNIVQGLSKNHMNSVPFSMLLPHQVLWGLENGHRNFIITTSHAQHDASGKMSRTHRALTLLAKTGIVDREGEEVIFYTPQTKWKLNLSRYHQVLQNFEPIRKSLGITYDMEISDLLKYF